MKHKIKFRILLIDDDKEMNRLLQRNLPHNISHEKYKYEIEIDYLDVEAEKVSETPKIKWKIKEKTCERICQLSNHPEYDLVIADYALPTPDAQRVLFGEDMSKKPDKSQLPGIIFTLYNLKEEFDNYLNMHPNTNRYKKKNIFTGNKNVILRSFASRMYFNVAGEMEDRVKQTSDAFKNAKIIPMNTRSLFYKWDEFYDIYDLVKPSVWDDYNIHYKSDDVSKYGRAHYRQLVTSYLGEMINTQVMKHYAKSAGKLRMRKTKLNIALYSGGIAAIGIITQFFTATCGSVFNNQPYKSLILFAIGSITVLLGAMFFPIVFEKVINTTVEFTNDD